MSIAATPEYIELFKILTDAKKTMTTEQQHTITIPGLPNGYRLVRIATKQNDRYRNGDGTSTIRGCDIVVEKIPLRRIVPEETEERNGINTCKELFAQRLDNGNITLRAMDKVDVVSEYVIEEEGTPIGTIWCDHGTWRLNAFGMPDLKTLKPILVKMKELQGVEK